MAAYRTVSGRMNTILETRSPARESHQPNLSVSTLCYVMNTTPLYKHRKTAQLHTPHRRAYQ